MNRLSPPSPVTAAMAGLKRFAVSIVIVGGLLVVAGLFPVLAPGNNYLLSVGSLALTFVVLGQGLNLVYGYAGFLAMGITSPWVIGGYTTAILVDRLDWDPVASVLAGAVLAGVAMALFGLATMGRGRSTFAILSLVFILFIEIVVRLWTDVTGGGMGISGLPIVHLGAIKIGTPTEFYYATLVVTVVVVIALGLLLGSVWGRTLRATNSDETLATSLGIALLKNRVAALTVASIAIGLIGGVHVLRLAVAVPSMAGLSYLAPLFAIVFLGGPGRFVGVLVASVVITFVPELSRDLDSWRNLFYGALLIVLCLLFPNGLPDAVAAARHRWRQARASRAPTAEPAPGEDFV